MRVKSFFVATGVAVLIYLVQVQPTAAQSSSVELNSNVIGRTTPGQYRGIPAMQDNEPSCAFNPLLVRNIICAWNASGGSDDPVGPGDTAIRMSETLDGGKTFFNRYINGTKLNPATSLNVEFTADPITLCWPGGCGILHIGAIRGEAGGTGGGIYMQRMMDLNAELGFRKALEPTPVQVYRSTGSKFADKVNGTYFLDEDNPGTIDVTMQVEGPDGSIETITRQWPKARILVTFALFNPSKNDIEILSMYTDNYGDSFSNPKQVAVTSGRDQGVSVTAMGDTVLYAFRAFGDDGQPSAMRGAISNDGGQRIGKPFDIVSPICAYDVPTFPNASNQTVVAARTNDFPSVSNNGKKFILVYSERKPSSDGGCFTTFDLPTDSRIKVVVASANGKNWSNPVEIAPYTDVGFQFMPVVDCSLGVCQVGWWDSRFDTQRVRNYLENVSTSPFAANALTAFLTYPVLADFNYNTGPNSVIQFRRTARVLTTKVLIEGNQPVATDDPPVVVSRYRKALIDGSVREIEGDGWNIKAYKTSSVPFMGDYSGMTSVKQRLVFDPDGSEPPFWEDNSSFDDLNPGKEPTFWMSFISSRNVKGDIYTGQPTDPVLFAPTPGATTVPRTGSRAPHPIQDNGDTRLALSVEDFNPGATPCTVADNLGAGALFDALNNRTKDFDIYGALIENRATAFSINPTKTLGSIQRSYVIIAENASASTKTFRLQIANQPVGAPTDARASWDQLPFDPPFTTAPLESETIEVGPRSSEATALFVVSAAAFNPVAVDIFEVLDDSSEVLINTITANGDVESGPLLNADGSLNEFEIHNPKIFNPDEFNPDEFNPDEYNPDEFNPDLYTPDEFNPDEFNPDEFNPDEFNPDEFNPDEFNPDEFNPDEFNPDVFNPDEFNAPLVDPASLNNDEIPDPDLGNIDGLVVKLDINYGVQNLGNTITPYTVDFALTDPFILDLIASGQLSTQLIAWQDKKIDDVQFCAPRIISENRVVAAVNNPDLATLEIPNINENRLGILTYVIGPGDVLQNTLRFIAPRALMEQIAPRLTADRIAYVFSSQVANTFSDNLNNGQELKINRPTVFNFQTGDTGTLEANTVGGAILPTDFVQAFRGNDNVPVTCTPALGDFISLDIDNTPDPGPTSLSCTALDQNGDPVSVDFLVSVLDTTPPMFDIGSVPGDVTIEAESPAGAPFVFAPSATDMFGVDSVIDISCSPASGSIFPLTAPGPTTTVECAAIDDSSNEAFATFDVNVQDTSAPTISDISPPLFDQTEPFVLADDASSFQLFWGPFNVEDADAAPTVSCSVGTLDPARSDIPNGLYVFVHDFTVGKTTVECTATDSGGFSASGSFVVIIIDDTPPVITLNGDATITIESGPGPYVDPGATAEDNSGQPVDIDIDSSQVDTTTAGSYTVYITATDSSGNTAELTRTVVVEFMYAGATGIDPRKTRVRAGSSNPLLWAWLDENSNAVDSSGDRQMLQIRDCSSGVIVLQMAGDPGASGFRFKANKYWQFNWETNVAPGDYCASVTSELTGQEQQSPPITVR